MAQQTLRRLTDRSTKLRILFVCFPYSVHAARWTRLLDGTGHDIHVFPSQPNHHLHEDFRDITFWPVPGLPFDAGNRPVQIGTLPDVPFSSPATRLAALIATGQFDIVHSLEFQHAGYLTLEAMAQLPATRPIWIATNYGSDISLFGKQPQHQARIREILAQCDYYSAECHRDIGLAQQLGLSKPIFAICPNSGGIDVELAKRLRTPGLSSARRIVAVKGYQHFAGRALTALQAIDLAKEHLAGYQVQIFSPFPEVRREADRLRAERGIEIHCLPEQVPHQDILRLHGSARVSIAISIGDGVSTALLEAMAMGAFPIQTCTACADEWIEDGRSGFIVQPDDVEQIRRCLITALTDDELVDRAASLNLCTNHRLGRSRSRCRQGEGRLCNDSAAGSRGHACASRASPPMHTDRDYTHLQSRGIPEGDHRQRAVAGVFRLAVHRDGRWLHRRDEGTHRHLRRAD